MQNLSNLFTDLFDDPKITNNRLHTYGINQVSRLTANNPAALYTPIITATTTALSALNNIMVAHGSSKGSREGSTRTKKETKEALTDYISQQEGLVKSVFGKKSGPYQEFFPQGVSVFSKGTEAEYNEAVQIILTKGEKYETQLGTPFLEQLVLLNNAWFEAYTTQGDDTVVTDNTGTQEDVAAKTLKLQLTKNAMFIAYNNINSTTAYDTYFDTTLLFASHRLHIYKGTAAINSTSVVHEIEYSEGKQFHMKNKGAVTLSFQMWLDDTPVGNSFEVLSGKVVEKSFADFFTVGNSLRVTNASTTTPSEYEVRELA